MKPKLAPVTELKTAGNEQDRPSVAIGDSVYYSHPENGNATHGVVAAIGKDGFLADADGGGEHQVTWDKYLGHRKRTERKLHIVDRGEDGFIAKDEEGKHVFVRGSLEDLEQGRNQPLEKAMPAPMPAEMLGELQRIMADMTEQITKALVIPRDVLPPGELSPLQKAQVVRELATAGFEPMMDYVRDNFGDNFVYRQPLSPESGNADVVQAIDRLAKAQATQFQALCAAVSMLAERLVTKDAE